DMTAESVTIDGEKIARSDCKITHLAQLHSKPLDLPNTRTILLISPPRYVQPFLSWESVVTSGKYSPLSWWQDYNALKHDRLLNLDKGTLATALIALCALHQVISRRTDLAPILIRHRWFSTGQYPVDYVLNKATQNSLSETHIVQTKLFATPLGARQF